MPAGRPLDVDAELLESFDLALRASEHLVAVLPPRIWRAQLPGRSGRSIAAIVAHMHSVRRTFAKMGGADPLMESLDRSSSTQAQARRALRQSREALARLFQRALTERRARVPGIPRRVVNMMLYLMQHDAHHRGQITMLARELGYKLSGADTMKLWGWKRME